MTLTLKGKQGLPAARDIYAVSKGSSKLSCIAFGFLLNFSDQLGRVYRSANIPPCSHY